MAVTNGWGQGVLNNLIGWGKGAINNTIGWGSAYLTSHSVDTEIYGFDADAQAFFTDNENKGGTIPSNVKAAYSAFVTREKDNGRYSKIKRLYPYLGGVIDSARIDAITLAQATNNNFVDADADATCGLQSDGSTKYLTDSAGLDSIYSDPFDIQMGAFWRGVPEKTNGRYIMGVASSPEWVSIRGKQGASSRSYCDIPTSNFAISDEPTDDGDFMMIRTSNNEFYMLTDGVEGAIQSTTASYSLSSTAPIMFGVSSAGVPAGLSEINSTGMFYAEGFSLSELKSFRASYRTFLTDIGVI